MECVFCHKNSAVAVMEKDISDRYCDYCQATVKMFVIAANQWLKAHQNTLVNLRIESGSQAVTIYDKLTCEPYTNEWFVASTRIKFSQLTAFRDDTLTIQW